LENRKLLAVSPEDSGKEFSANGFFWLWVFDIMEKPEIWILKGDRNISDLYRLLFRRPPLPSRVS
jgi:hypothetical protein